MTAYIEHANIDVGDLDDTVRFLKTAIPEFAVRGGGTDNGARWVHIGTDAHYVTLNETLTRPILSAGPLNHIGFVVDDVAAIKSRLLQAGYKEGFVTGPHPHRKRLYFLDSDGLEWEFVQYLSPEPSKRNDYAL